MTLIIPSSEDPDGLKHIVLSRLQSYGLAEEISSTAESSSWALTPLGRKRLNIAQTLKNNRHALCLHEHRMDPLLVTPFELMKLLEKNDWVCKVRSSAQKFPGPYEDGASQTMVDVTQSDISSA